MRIYRRKFRSQTSDLWTNAATAVRAVREEKEKESEEREPEKRQSVKKKRNAQKGRNVAKHYAMFFVCFRAREGRKVGSLKQRVRSHLVG